MPLLSYASARTNVDMSDETSTLSNVFFKAWKQLMVEKISLMTIKTDRLKYFTNRNNHDNKDSSPHFLENKKSNSNNYNFFPKSYSFIRGKDAYYKKI